MAASPFSFHCMICFEEFDIESRYPVVLPCGHTYVCNQCAQRLEKCMECRTSLVQTIPGGHAGNEGQYGGRGGGRWNSRPVGNRSPGAPPQPPLKRRLPLPKNVVLMSLIEATELAAENVRSQEQRPSLSESPGLPNAILDIEEEEEEKIKTGTTLAISDCGTYAVASKSGLEIYPSRPESVVQANQEKSEEEEVDTLVRFFHLDHKLDLVEDDGTQQRQPSVDGDVKGAAPVRLGSGDRVQIVSTEAGWAKLARGYGFVRADKNQLVKVGSSVDRACKLEALLRLLSTRRKDLRNDQKRVDNQFISLMNELQVSLMSDEDLTVIAADAFQDKKPNGCAEEAKVDLEQPLSQDVELSDKYKDSTPLKPRPMERPMTPPHTMEMTRGFFCSSGDVFDAVIPGAAPRQPTILPTAVAATPAIVEHALAQTHSQVSSNNSESTPTRILRSAPNPSPSALRAGARAWREMHGRASTNSPNGGIGIDFRTGMSGHGGLTSASSHPHDYLEPRMGTVFRGFSNHSGASMWKTGRSKHGTRPPPPIMPMFPVPQNYRRHYEDASHHNIVGSASHTTP